MAQTLMAYLHKQPSGNESIMRFPANALLASTSVYLIYTNLNVYQNPVKHDIVNSSVIMKPAQNKFNLNSLQSINLLCIDTYILILVSKS